MANIKASQKDIRRIAKRSEWNRSMKSRLKRLRTKALKAIEAGDAPATSAACVELISATDKAVKRGVIHPNRAARVKSSFGKHITGATTAATAPVAAATPATEEAPAVEEASVEEKPATE